MRTVQKEHLHVHIIDSVTVHKYCATAWKYKQAIGLKYYCPSYVDSMTTYMLHGETLDANSLENWLGHSKDSFYTINIHPYKMYSLYSYHQYNLPQLVLF